MIAAIVEPDTLTSPTAFENGLQLDPDCDAYLSMSYKSAKDTLIEYEWAAGELEQNLGCAVWFENDRGMHLDFHPQQSMLLAKPEDKDGKAEEQG